MKNELHVYDGIVEENNPMPTWWVWLFIFTIIFAFIYWLHYQFGEGENLKQEYQKAMANYQAQVEKSAMNETVETEESLTSYMKNEMAITAGSAIFTEKCSMCHGLALEGKIGPNLTDNFWINGRGTRLDILTLITNGSAAKGMPPWKGLLKPRDIKNAASFVFSKIGSKPANPKEPQGTEIK